MDQDYNDGKPTAAIDAELFSQVLFEILEEKGSEGFFRYRLG